MVKLRVPPLQSKKPVVVVIVVVSLLIQLNPLAQNVSEP